MISSGMLNSRWSPPPDAGRAGHGEHRQRLDDAEHRGEAGVAQRHAVEHAPAHPFRGRLRPGTGTPAGTPGCGSPCGPSCPVAAR